MKVTAYQIIETLQKKGYEAYFAGGCVRDMLLGTQPKDFDIATSATPDQVEEIFEKTVPIGKSFGVILVIQNGHHYEIATFRSESEYADGRRPTKIEFTTAQQDALRRDFTINGLFFDPLKGQSGETQDQVVDFVEGQKDLKARLIRLSVIRKNEFKKIIFVFFAPFASKT
jgi:poly(A) polymerase